MESHRQRRLLTTAFVLAMLAGRAAGAQYLLPDTLHIKVIFYDFHYGDPDGAGPLPANPNFGACNCGTNPGMVLNTLDADRKPILAVDDCCNGRIAEWYRPSGAVNPVFDWRNARWTSGVVPRPGRPNEWIGSAWDSTYDMVNIVIYDSLPFTLLDSATGTYRFLRTNRQAFYWLDGRGFGEEPAGSGHNYGFSMELHHEFLYQGGEHFQFAGDDDVWVFINGRLALDLGGMQNAVKRGIVLDDMAAQLGITVGQRYMFDFFYNERRQPQSDCDITTNILTPAKPKFMLVTRDSVMPTPGNIPQQFGSVTIQAGEQLDLYAWPVDDSMKVRPEWTSSIVWQVTDTLGNPINQTVFTGASAHFLLTEAYGTVTLNITYYDPNFPDVKFMRVIKVNVRPGPATQLVIEGSPDSTRSLRNANPIPEVTIGLSVTSFPVYAILRDEYGNWVGCAAPVTWSSRNLSVVSVQSGQAALGEGIIRRVGSSGQTQVVATSGGFSDSVLVTLEGVPYDAVRIAGVDVVNDTLRLGVGISTTLTAEGRNALNGTWERVEVRWDADGVSLSPAAPTWDDQWVGLSGRVPDTGVVYIRKPGQSGATLSDTVVVIIRQLIPSSPPDHVVIEGSLNWTVSPARDNPIDTVRIASNETTARVYAIIRDGYGTYYSYSQGTNWTSTAPGVVTVARGLDAIGEGVITRAASGTGTALIIAENTSLPGLVKPKDTTVVVLLGYTYTQIRIVVESAGSYVPITHLALSAMNDTTIRAQGLRSDNGTWEPVQVRWSTSLGLSVSPDAPERASQWTFMVTAEGDSGWIEISFRDSLTYRLSVVSRRDTVVQRPNHLVIEGDLALTTGPTENELDTLRIPRDSTTGTLYAVIRNGSGGYVRWSQPTEWISLDPAVVTVTGGVAALGQGIVTKVASSGVARVVARDPSTDLESAADTVYVKILTYGYTALRILVNGVEVDSANVRLDSGVVLTVQGRRSDNGGWEPVQASWIVSGLTTTAPPPGSSSVYNLVPGTFAGAGSATVTATYIGLRDSVRVRIRAAPTMTSLAVAVTRDSDGDGLLDRIDLRLDSALTGGLPPAGAFTVSANGRTFTVDSVRYASGDSLRGLVLYLAEIPTAEGQTGWLPTVRVAAGFSNLRAGAVACTDGAGPVAWRAVRHPGAEGQPDTLVMTFSEPVVWDAGATAPGSVFYLYRLDSLCSGAFTGNSMGENGGGAVIVMSNGFVLQVGRDSVQLIGGIAEPRDAAGNRPPADGRRAVVERGGRTEVTVFSGPNPFVPGVTEIPAAAQQFYHNVISGSRSGVIIGIGTPVPLKEESPGSGRYGTAWVYDPVGNVVIDNLPVRMATEYSYGAFWDGRNENGRIVGSGTYLCVVTVTNINGQTFARRTKVGVSRR